MSFIDDLIKKIPKQFQDLAQAHLSILAGMAKDEVLAWIDLILKGDYETAYQVTNDRMTPSERIAEQKRLNTLYEFYNKDAKAKNDMLLEFFRQILLIAISMLWAKVE